MTWVEHFGWTLVHFLWQGLAIAVLYAGVRWSVAREWSAQARYLLACSGLAAMMAAPLVTWEVLRPATASPDAVYQISNAPPRNDPARNTSAAVSATQAPVSVRTIVASARPARFLFWVVMAWLAGAAVFGARLTGGWIFAARLRRERVRRAPAEWQEILDELGRWIGLSRPVRLLVSALTQTPMVIGWLSPVVLVPVGTLGGLPVEHLELLLLHELAHIRRRDYLVNILQSVAEALLFYHPAVWWVSAHIRLERELCCDDVAVSAGGDVLTYAQALMELEAYRPAHRNVAVAANGGSLVDRIARLLGQPRPTAATGLGPGVLAVAFLLMTAAYGLFAQTDVHPAFDVASIRLNTNTSAEQPMGVSYRGGRLRARDASVMLLIQFAYADHDSAHSLPLLASQVVGGPDWIHSLRYEIEAKTEENTNRKQGWLMLQALLADRFQLRLHREMRELPVYDLKAAKKGLKLPAPKDVSCISMPTDGTPPPYTPGKVDCGYIPGPMNGWKAGLKLQGSKVRMADLIRELAFTMGRPVLDRTQFTGDFDLNLSFTADETTLGLPGTPPAADPNLPSIFAALEEQLGLKMTAAKGPVEVLVIDHAERPTAN